MLNGLCKTLNLVAYYLLNCNKSQSQAIKFWEKSWHHWHMKVRQTTLICVFCGAVLGGIGLAKFVVLQPGWWLVGLIPVVFLIRKKNVASLFAVVILGLGIGMLRGGYMAQDVATLKNYSKQKVTILATAQTDSIYGKKSQITFDAGKVKLLLPQQEDLVGKFSISGFGEPMVYRGDKVEVSGKLYLTRGSKQAGISYAKIRVVEQGNDVFAKIRRNFAAGLQSAVPEPEASLGLGLLIGQRSTLPPDVLLAMTTVGLVHIVAVSGYNVTILARGVQRLRFFRSKYQKLVVALSLVTVFIIITGFSASVVRAALVSYLSLLAWYYGRKFKPLLLILLVAAVTALFNPIYLWSDIGWYLSFLAFFGVLVMAPLLGRKLLGYGYDKKSLSMLVLESFSAQLLTLPLIMLIFGRVSVVSLPANLLVVPIIPFAMLFSAIAGIAGMWVPAVAGWFAWPANFLLTYILDVTKLAAMAPYANVGRSLNTAMALIFYGLILLCVAALYRHYHHSRVSDESTLTP